jgi:hypothetical protein
MHAGTDVRSDANLDHGETKVTTTTQSKNLDLIRWMNFGNARTAKLLSSVISNATYLSKMATGEMVIHGNEAVAIERKLNLPKGWMDRDNLELLTMSAEDFATFKLLASLPAEGKNALHTLLVAARKSAA